MDGSWLAASQDGSVERIQIKKKDEAYQWLPSELKPILKKFFQTQKANDRFMFVTNAPGNKDLRRLKELIKVWHRSRRGYFKKIYAGRDIK